MSRKAAKILGRSVRKSHKTRKIISGLCNQHGFAMLLGLVLFSFVCYLTLKPVWTSLAALVRILQFLANHRGNVARLTKNDLKHNLALQPIELDTQFYEEEHLALLSLPLYYQALNILESYNCSNRSYSVPVESLILCTNRSHDPTYLTVLTTMYHEKNKQYIFNNTLHNWAALRHHNVTPILYLSDDSMVVGSGRLVHSACTLGWTVAFVPHCNNNGFPVLRSMLNHARNISQSTWYCYANGDVLFGDNLISSMHFLDRTPFPTAFAALRRRDAFIYPNATWEHLTDLLAHSENLPLHPPTGMDCFLFHALRFPFHKLKSLIIGRPLIDNYLVVFTLLRGLCPVDITDTVTCVHQAVGGYSNSENSHLSNKLDLTYNERYMKAWLDYLRRTYIDCIPYITSKIHYRTYRESNSTILTNATLEYLRELNYLNATGLEYYHDLYPYLQFTMRPINWRCGRKGKDVTVEALIRANLMRSRIDPDATTVAMETTETYQGTGKLRGFLDTVDGMKYRDESVRKKDVGDVT